MPARRPSRSWRWVFRRASHRRDSAGFVFLQRPKGITAGPQAVGTVRVAILPFVNLTGDSALEYLGDGLTDEVIPQLGLLNMDVAVIARTSAMSYRGSSKNVGQIGAELDAVYVVESSVRKHGEGLRVASRLIRVADQTSSAGWSETFDQGASAGNLQQTRAATRLARLIALELAPASVSDRPTKATSDSTAWEAFLKGKALMNSGRPRTSDRRWSNSKPLRNRIPPSPPRGPRSRKHITCSS